jgi:hypothetical protein
MNNIRRLTIARLILAIAILMVSFAGHADAICTNFIINNPTGVALIMKLQGPTGMPKTFIVNPGSNTYPSFVPLGAESAHGTTITVVDNCTTCYAVATALTPGVICLKWCYNPMTCVLTIDADACAPPTPCLP